MKITVTRLDSGYYHVRGIGPCNWAQPPVWPCDERTLREHAFPEAGEEFVRAALALANATDQETRCPHCGYTEEDKRIHGDHRLCDQKNKPEVRS